MRKKDILSEKNDTESKLALCPSGIPKREPPGCEAPREPTIYVCVCFLKHKIKYFTLTQNCSILNLVLMTPCNRVLKVAFSHLEKSTI